MRAAAIELCYSFSSSLHLHLPLASEVGNAGGEGHRGTHRESCRREWMVGVQGLNHTAAPAASPYIARALVAGAVPTRHIPMLGGLRLSAAAAAPAAVC